MKRSLQAATVITLIALLALLGYSLERTNFLFSLFEEDDTLPLAAALVVELAAVALIVGAGALHQIEARAWANRALGVVLSVQALANLSAGYLRGDWATLQGLGRDNAARAVMSVLWLVTNLAVPLLVLFLSKLLERLIAALAVRGGVAIVESGVGERAPEAVAVPGEAPVEQEHAAPSPALSKTAKVKRLAAQRGVSESTIWRKVGTGEVSLNGVEH